ncbi:DUF6053 domain-containing protein [Lysobacter enzymogenes]
MGGPSGPMLLFQIAMT